MAIEATPYATDTKTVVLLEREAANLTEITIYRDGDKVQHQQRHLYAHQAGWHQAC